LGLLTCKNRLPYNLYCVGGDVKHCTIQSDITVRALFDNGAQVSIIKAELLDRSEMEVMGQMRLQPFCGNAVEADCVKLQISPFTTEDHDNTYITIDCAVVSNCNENMILTADVLSRMAQYEQAKKVRCNNANQSVSTSDSVKELNVSTNTVDANVLLNDDAIDDSVTESVERNRFDECDDVDDANQHSEGTNIPNESLTHDIASCQQVVEEHRNDEPPAGCFRLAKAGKGGF